MTTQTLPLNLIPKGVCPRLYVSQYDKGQEWNFDIYAGTEAYTIPSGSTVTIQGTKPDKTGFQYACSFSGNRVTATEQQQMTIIAGEVPAEIRIEKNNEIIATLNFIIAVEKAALADDTVISETDLPLIEEAIEVLGHADELVSQIQGYVSSAETAATNAGNSATAAAGSASTASTKASQASTSASNAATSASNAAGSASTASTKASEAASSASTASTKASEAAGSANTASTKASEAAASAQAAAQSAAHLTIDSAMSTTSENALQNKVITTTIQNLSNQVNTLRNYDANTGVKNLFPVTVEGCKNNNSASGARSWNGNTMSYNGANWTVNSDGSVTMSGTNTANNPRNLELNEQGTAFPLKAGNYILSVRGVSANATVIFGGSADIPFTEFSTDTDFEFTMPSDNAVITYFLIQAKKNVALSGTIRVMIRDKSITDGTMQSNSFTNEELTRDKVGMDLLSEVGAVSLVNSEMTTHIFHGITFTYNSDGSVTPSGTADANLISQTSNSKFTVLKKGTYILRGSIKGTVNGNPKYILSLRDASNNILASLDANTNDYKVFTLSNDTSLTFVYYVLGGVTPSATDVFYPMVTPVEYTGPYVPYAKTNRELTKELEITNGTTNISSVTWKKVGKIVTVKVYGITISDSIIDITGLPIPLDYALAYLIEAGKTSADGICGLIQLVPDTSNHPYSIRGTIGKTVYGSLVYIAKE